MIDMITGPFKYITMLFSLPYFLVLYIRHALYDTGVLKSTHFPEITTIVVGNLNVGGSGKTPFTKFLFSHLKASNNVVILSRGYGRKSKGFFEVTSDGSVEQFGDEALELKQATGANIFVCESRVEGIKEIIKRLPSTKIILLDDALQHRKLQSDIKILLSTFDLPYYKDQLLPFGTLRDIKQAAAYADILVMTKSPKTIQESDIIDMHHHAPFQYGETAFYSQITYLPVINPETQKKLTDANNLFVVGVSAIAKPKFFNNQLRELFNDIDFYKKLDHSYFTESDCKNIVSILDKTDKENTAVVCTEKDYNKLNFAKRKYGCNFDLYILPISVDIAFDKEPFFLEALEELIPKELKS
jgi:tetraacyldisaccharide 4'-kinase